MLTEVEASVIGDMVDRLVYEEFGDDHRTALEWDPNDVLVCILVVDKRFEDFPRYKLETYLENPTEESLKEILADMHRDPLGHGYYNG